MSTVSDAPTLRTVSGPALGPAMRAASLVVPGKRCPKTILRNVALRTGARCMDVFATDLDCSIRVTVGDGPCDQVGTLVPIDVAAVMGKATGVQSLAVDTSARRLMLGGATVPTGDVKDYPHADTPMSGECVTLPLRWVSMVADNVANACDDESSRYSLGSVLLHATDHGLRAVGTDGRRMHVLTVPGVNGECLERHQLPAANRPADDRPLIPARVFAMFDKAVRAVVKALPKPMQRSVLEGTFDLRVGGTVARREVEFAFQCGPLGLRVRSYVCEGRFPRYMDIFSDGRMDTPACTIPPHGVVQIAEAGRVTTPTSKGVLLHQQLLEARSVERGEYSAPASWPVAGNVHTKLDPVFWREALEGCIACGVDAVPMYWTDKQSAVFFGANGGLRPQGEAWGFAGVVMPLAAD